MWELLLPQITYRDNFNEGHLAQLEELCCMYEEADRLKDTIELIGTSYIVEIRGVQTMKPVPEAPQLVACRAQIAIYTRMLGLMLAKNLAPISNCTEISEKWD